MRLVHYQCLIAAQEQRSIFKSVRCICQQIIVIANLDVGFHGIAQILLVAAIQAHKAIARAGLRYTNAAAIIPGKFRDMIHVQNIFCNAQAAFLPRSFRMHQRCSFGKAGIADKAFFALADNGCDGCCNVNFGSRLCIIYLKTIFDSK